MSKLTKKDDKTDKRCASPGCTKKVTDDDWCFGCKFYICESHERTGASGSHDVVEHWDIIDDWADDDE